MAEKQLRFALIGCGRIALNHIAAAYDNWLSIVALCDINSQSIDSLKKACKDKRPEILDTFDHARIYGDYHALLESEMVDVIAIATPSGSHFEIARDCINKGLNVIIEKPIALSVNESRELIALSREQKVCVTVCHQNRYNKSVKRLLEEVQADSFGKMNFGTIHVLWNRNQEYYTQAPWRGTWNDDGGFLMNQCIHCIDLLLWLMQSDVDEVKAYTANRSHSYIQTEDVGIAVLRFKNGALGVIEGTSTIYPKNLEETLYLSGESGTVKLGGKSVNIIEEWNLARYDEQESQAIKAEFHENPPNIYGFGHSPLYADFIKAIQEQCEPMITLEDASKAMEVVLALYKSEKDGVAVKLPLKNFATTDMAGYFD
ncbi:MAG: Gfo/Idh/MocA family oxidoreductase [Spirochaetaceae bacterium]|jgi:predicted dehydrogenase|nr:Gfo/Idh/MocA family oxidoreductase [Spirochaetaceae bacterium]